MTLDLKNNSLKIDPLERHALAAQLLSQMIISPDHDSDNANKITSPDEFKETFNLIIKSEQEKKPLSYFPLIQNICSSINSLNCPIIQLIDIYFLDILVDALNIFDDVKCIYISFLCISQLSLIEKFRDFFFSKDVFQISLNALNSEDYNVSYNALKVISTMIEDALKKEIQFDMNYLIETLDSNQQKTRDHEYFVISILRSIVEFSDFDAYYDDIINVICNIPSDKTPEENLAAVGDTIYLILKQNFKYFAHIHFQLGITGVLLEQLNENTIITQDIYFAIPILQIILCVIRNLKKRNLNIVIQFAKMISFEIYEQLIRESIVEVSELALQIISFLITHDSQYYLDLCFKNKLTQTVISKFIDEAPFYKKHVGIKFLLSVSKVIKDISQLDFILSLNIIEKCSFVLDGDDYKALLQYLKTIHILLLLASNLKATNHIKKVNTDLQNFDVIERSHQVLESFSIDDEYACEHDLQLITHIIDEIMQIIKTFMK